jgi:predicted NBD/HSP70 family sugar kinase
VTTTASPPGGQSLLRRHNAALVLSILLDESRLTRAEFARRAGLSKPTINEVVGDLIEARLVEETAEVPVGSVRAGPRGRPLVIRSDGGALVGVDIGANKVQTLVTDLAGTVLASDRRSTTSGEQPRVEAVLAQVRNSITAALRGASVDLAEVRAIGVGVPGDVNLATGEVTLVPQIDGFDGLNLRDLIQTWFPCPIYVDNEVHLAVLGERWRGAARGIDDAVLINVGIGIAAGILIGGSLHRGATGAAGEIGYLPLVEDWSRDPPPGGWGVLEYAAGGGAYARLAREAADGRPGGILRQLAEGHPERLDARTVFAAARLGDPESQRIVNQLLGLLARAVATVALVLDASTIVLAGGLARAGKDFLDPLSDMVDALVPRRPQLVLTELGDDAVSLGAIYVAHRAVWAGVRVSPFVALGP